MENTDLSKSLYYFEVHSYNLGLNESEKYLAAIQFLPRGEVTRFLDDLGLGRKADFKDLKAYLLSNAQPSFACHKFKTFYHTQRSFRDLVEQAKEMSRDPPDEIQKIFFTLMLPPQLQDKAMCALKYRKEKFFEIMELNLDEYNSTPARFQPQKFRRNFREPRPQRGGRFPEGNETFQRGADPAAFPPLCGPHKQWGARSFQCWKGNCAFQHLIKPSEPRSDPPQRQGN